MDNIVHLQALGSSTQLCMFLTGPAEEGKSTAVKTAESCVSNFVCPWGIPLTYSTYMYIAYMGSTDSLLGGAIVYV